MRAPPLWALPAAAAIVAALLAAMIPAYRQKQSEANQLWPLLVERAMDSRGDVESPGNEKRSPLSIIAIGTSLLTCATVHDGQMDSLARDLGKRPLRWRKICGGGRKWDALPLVEAVCAARPRVLLIENDLLFLRSRDWDGDSSEFEEFLGYLRFHALLAINPPGSEWKKTWPIRILPSASDRPTIVTVTPAMIVKNERAREKGFHPEDLPRYLRVLREAHAAGVTIVILDLALPSCPVAWTPGQLAKIGELQGMLGREVGAVILKCPLEFGPGDYYDAAHLNPAARRRLSGWLVEELDKLPVP